MSDLQDIIVSSSVKAFNSGLAHGVVQERDRIIGLLEKYAEHDESCYDQGKVVCTFEDCHADDFLLAICLIKGEQK